MKKRSIAVTVRSASHIIGAAFLFSIASLEPSFATPDDLAPERAASAQSVAATEARLQQGTSATIAANGFVVPDRVSKATFSTTSCRRCSDGKYYPNISSYNSCTLVNPCCKVTSGGVSKYYPGICSGNDPNLPLRTR